MSGESRYVHCTQHGSGSSNQRLSKRRQEKARGRIRAITVKRLTLLDTRERRQERAVSVLRSNGFPRFVRTWEDGFGHDWRWLVSLEVMVGPLRTGNPLDPSRRSRSQEPSAVLSEHLILLEG